MKRAGKIAIGLAAGLLLSAGVRADDVASADNPYAPIVTRNIFGLNPVQASEPTGEPPPKITLNGIMSTLGKVQVLFKVAGTSKPGQPDQSYILSEGQRQDEIEVMHINDKNNLVTFNNHGTLQEIPLASTPGTSGPGSGGQGSRQNFSRPGAGPGGGGGGGSYGGNGTGNSSGRGGSGGQYRGTGGNGFDNLQSVPTRPGYSSQAGPRNPPFTLKPEEQIIMIAAQHLQAQQEGSPRAAIFPPTVIDAEAGIGTPSPPQ